MPKLFPLNMNHLHDSTIVKCLGRGSFGDVKLYKCKEREKSKNGQIVECSECFVVKHIVCKKRYWSFFNYSKSDDSKVKKMLLNEYTIGALLHHPNIRETLDIDLVDNCIIFEYCNGCDLYSYLQLTHSKNELLSYFKQMVNAVEYIHGKGIAHRDLKLENIMIDDDKKTLKLIDFGEACVCDRNGYSSGIHGSTPYIAPEEFIKQDYDALKVDIWAIGIILYDITYICMPWKIANSTDVRFDEYRKAFEAGKFILPQVKESDVLYKLFKTMLNPNPEVRGDIQTIKKILDGL